MTLDKPGFLLRRLAALGLFAVLLIGCGASGDAGPSDREVRNALDHDYQYDVHDFKILERGKITKSEEKEEYFFRIRVKWTYLVVGAETLDYQKCYGEGVGEMSVRRSKDNFNKWSEWQGHYIDLPKCRK